MFLKSSSSKFNPKKTINPKRDGEEGCVSKIKLESIHIKGSASVYFEKNVPLNKWIIRKKYFR